MHYRRWLAAVCPEWAAMKVTTAHKYLGVEVGFGVSLEARWSAASKKVRNRVTNIASAGVAPSLGLRHLSSHIAPVLSYVAQVAPPTKQVAALHGMVIERVLHFPHRSLPRAAVPALHEVGLRVPPAFEVDVEAAGMLAAMRHTEVVRAAARLLDATCSEHAPLAALADPAAHFDGQMWAAPAIADTMLAAPERAEAMRAAHGDDASEERKVTRAQARKWLLAQNHGTSAAAAWVPWLSRWVGIPAPLLARLAGDALGSLRTAAPRHAVALLRTWADAWQSSQRRGVQVSACLACGGCVESALGGRGAVATACGLR